MPSTCSIILDIETLSLSPNALVTEIAAIAFNRADFVPFDHVELSPGFFQQILMGRHICPKTIAYHIEKRSLPEQISHEHPQTTIDRLIRFIETYNPEHIWIQGPDFDRPILENLSLAVDRALPWKHWQMRDARTIWNAAFPGVKHDPRPHRALKDCQATLTDLARSLIKLNTREAA